MGRLDTMERVLHNLRIILNKEDVVLEYIVEAFGEEEGGNQCQDGDKLEDQEYEPPRGAMVTELSFILDVITNH